MSRSSELSINVSLIFDMHDLNGELFLKVNFFSFYQNYLLQQLLSLLQQSMHYFNHINLILTLKL